MVRDNFNPSQKKSTFMSKTIWKQSFERKRWPLTLFTYKINGLRSLIKDFVYRRLKWASSSMEHFKASRKALDSKAKIKSWSISRIKYWRLIKPIATRKCDYKENDFSYGNKRSRKHSRYWNRSKWYFNPQLHTSP